MRRESEGAQRRQAWAHQRCTFRLQAADHTMRMQRVGGGSAPDARVAVQTGVTVRSAGCLLYMADVKEMQ